MKVKATQVCFYDNKTRKPGDIFELKDTKGKKWSNGKLVDHLFKAEDLFSKVSMVLVDKPAAAKPKPVAQQQQPAAKPVGKSRWKKLVSSSDDDVII